MYSYLTQNPITARINPMAISVNAVIFLDEKAKRRNHAAKMN